jgi:hypothetical protein
LGVVRSTVLGDGSTDAQQNEERDVDSCALEVDGATTEPGSEEPGTSVGNEAETAVDQTELEGEVVVHTGL